MKIKTIATLLVLMTTTLAYGVQNAPEWVKYTSPEGRYSVLVPQEPQLSSQPGTAKTGEKFTQYLAASKDSSALYMIGYFDYPTTMTFSFDDARDGMVTAVKGTLLGEEMISLGGYPGRELKVSAIEPKSGGEFSIRVRIYDVGRRVYMVQYIFPKSSDPSVTSKNAARFFDSFKVEAGR